MAAEPSGAGAPAHSHGSGTHTHGASADADRAKLAIVLVLIVGFMAAEVAAGIVAHSLALISDAGHMLTDAAAIGLSLFALHLARRPAEGSMTFGFRRVEILSAQANGITLVVISGVIVYEAVRRLITPPDVEGGLMLIVALAGIGVNVVATWILARANRQSLNVEGAFRHIVTDLYAFIGTVVAAALILITGFERADPIASLVVAGLMCHSAYVLLRASGRIFMEAAPEDVDPTEIGEALLGVAGVVEVHDLHVWEVSSGFPALSAHVLVRQDADCHRARLQLADLLEKRFDIHHSTLQVEHRPERLLHIRQ